MDLKANEEKKKEKSVYLIAVDIDFIYSIFACSRYAMHTLTFTLNIRTHTLTQQQNAKRSYKLPEKDS